MAETTYTTVTWTAGDILTEAKLDNMTANDRAVDAMAQGVEFAERANPDTPVASKIHFFAKDDGGLTKLFIIEENGKVQKVSVGGGKINVIAYGATVDTNYLDGKQHQITLTGDIILNEPTNMLVGDTIFFDFIQDVTGGRAVTWWAGIKWPGSSAPDLSDAGSKIDTLAVKKRSSGYLGYIVGMDSS